MPRDASLSDSYTPDRCSFSSSAFILAAKFSSIIIHSDRNLEIISGEIFHKITALNLVNWGVPGGILSRIATATIVEIPVEKYQIIRIENTNLKSFSDRKFLSSAVNLNQL